MARDDTPASSTAAVLLAAWRPQCAVKWDRNLKPKLAIMRQCTSITDRQTDGHWHRSIYLHLALIKWINGLHVLYLSMDGETRPCLVISVCESIIIGWLVGWLGFNGMHIVIVYSTSYVETALFTGAITAEAIKHAQVLVALIRVRCLVHFTVYMSLSLCHCFWQPKDHCLLLTCTCWAYINTVHCSVCRTSFRRIDKYNFNIIIIFQYKPSTCMW